MDAESSDRVIPSSSQEAVSGEIRRSIERWLVARGVPQLIHGYRSEPRVDARALPLIVAWLVVATAVLWVVRPEIYFAGRFLNDLEVAGWADGLFGAGIGAMLVALVATGLVMTALLWSRRHPPFRSNVPLDVFDSAAWGLVPGVVAAVITGDPGAAPPVAAFVLSGVGIIYVLVALGIPELTGWGLHQLREDLPHIAMVVARSLPLLLILVVFLLFAAELWQVTHALTVGDLIAVAALLAIVGSVFVVAVAGQQIRTLADRGHDRELGVLLTGTPAAGLAGTRALAPSPQRLRRSELLNLVVLVLISQLMQALFVALMVALFLVLLGMILVPASVQEAWAGAAVRELWGFALLDEPSSLSVELVVAAGLLGGMCGLYFMGFALTDATYRAEFDARVMADIQRILAVRSVYLNMADAAVRGGRPPPSG